MDPGGESVMGNAAFGTKNSGPKTAGQLPKASEYGAAIQPPIEAGLAA